MCVPAIFYGSKIKKGSVQLDYYITGALCAQLKDSGKNGELVETVGTKAGSVPGVVLYEQGIIVLTGSHSLHASHTENYFGEGAVAPTWVSFASGMSEAGTPSGFQVSSTSTYSLSVKGTNKIPTLTMLAHANLGDHNYSHNPTFCADGKIITGSTTSSEYLETPGTIKNIKKSPYSDFEEAFENATYISKIGIYDEDKNLIAIATLANPVKKTELREYTFKLRMDF